MSRPRERLYRLGDSGIHYGYNYYHIGMSYYYATGIPQGYPARDSDIKSASRKVVYADSYHGTLGILVGTYGLN